MANSKFPAESTTYETSDKRIFTNINEANKHQNEINFIEWINKSNLIIMDHTPTIDDIGTFLIQNKANILEFYKNTPKIPLDLS